MVGKEKNYNKVLIAVLMLIIAAIFGLIIWKSHILSPKEQVKKPVASSVVKTPSSSNSSGGVLFGLNRASSNPYDVVTAHDAQLGRRYDVVQVQYTSWQQVLDWSRATGPLVTKPEYKLSNEGRIPHISLVLPETWNSFAFNLRNKGSGRRLEVERFAQNLQTYLPGPFIISINDIPEKQRSDAGGNSPQDFTDAFCATYQVFKLKDATKAKFVSISAADTYGNTRDAGARFYPGDQCVDWVGARALNDQITNWQNLVDIIKSSDTNEMSWYDWATRDWTGDGSSFNNPTRYGVVTNLDGTQETKLAKGTKPLLLLFGSREDSRDTARKSQWLQQAKVDVASKLSNIKAVEYYDVGDSSNFLGSETFQAWKEFGLTGLFNSTKGLAEGDVTSPAAQKRLGLFNSEK